MKMIKLTMVAGTEAVDNQGEDDGLLSSTREVTQPTYVMVDQVRNFYPRKAPRVGTRIMFRNGAALPVTEDLEAVADAIRSA